MPERNGLVSDEFDEKKIDAMMRRYFTFGINTRIYF
jgi:hypothetical protein